MVEVELVLVFASMVASQCLLLYCQEDGSTCWRQTVVLVGGQEALEAPVQGITGACWAAELFVQRAASATRNSDMSAACGCTADGPLCVSALCAPCKD